MVAQFPPFVKSFFKKQQKIFCPGGPAGTAGPVGIDLPGKGWYTGYDKVESGGAAVAVANAIGAVLDAADEAAADNDSDGVARWIEKNLL